MPSFVLGLGCKRGIAAAPLLELARTLLAEIVDKDGAIPLRAIASLDRRAEEPALLAVAAHYNVPLLSFSADRLEAETARLATPSAAVHAVTGCPGVAEGAALAAVGVGGWLAVPKRTAKGATAALAVTRGVELSAAHSPSERAPGDRAASSSGPIVRGGAT